MQWPVRVGAVIYDPLEDEILMQWRRDAWSCFGDDCLKGEKPHQAIKRALEKRLKIKVVDRQLIGFGAFTTTRGRTSAQYLMLHHEKFNPLKVSDLKRRWFAVDEAMSLAPPMIQVHTHHLLDAFGTRVTLKERLGYREILRKLGLSETNS